MEIFIDLVKVAITVPAVIVIVVSLALLVDDMARRRRHRGRTSEYTYVCGACGATYQGIASTKLPRIVRGHAC